MEIHGPCVQRTTFAARWSALENSGLYFPVSTWKAASIGIYLFKGMDPPHQPLLITPGAHLGGGGYIPGPGAVKVWPPLMASIMAPQWLTLMAPIMAPPRKTTVVGRTNSSFRKQSENVNVCNWVVASTSSLRFLETKSGVVVETRKTSNLIKIKYGGTFYFNVRNCSCVP